MTRSGKTTASSPLAGPLTVFALLLFASGCSGSADSAEASTVVESSTADSTTEADPAETDPAGDSGADGPAVPITASPDECAELSSASTNLAAVSLSLTNDADNFESYAYDVQALQALVDTWRPYQDVNPELGNPVRDSLDNISKDIAAADEGRLDDFVGDFVHVNFLFVEETICP